MFFPLYPSQSSKNRDKFNRALPPTVISVFVHQHLGGIRRERKRGSLPFPLTIHPCSHTPAEERELYPPSPRSPGLGEQRLLLPETCPAVPRPELGHQPEHPPCHSPSWCHPRALLGKGTVSVTCNDQLAWLCWGPWQGSEALAVNRRCAARHKLPGGCPGPARCCLLGRERTALLTAATRHGRLAPLRWGIAASSRLGLRRVLEPGRQRCSVLEGQGDKALAGDTWFKATSD